LEPSSITSSSAGGFVCPKTLSMALAIYRAPSRTGMITLTFIADLGNVPAFSWLRVVSRDATVAPARRCKLCCFHAAVYARALRRSFPSPSRVGERARTIQYLPPGKKTDQNNPRARRRGAERRAFRSHNREHPRPKVQKENQAAALQCCDREMSERVRCNNRAPVEPLSILLVSSTCMKAICH